MALPEFFREAGRVRRDERDGEGRVPSLAEAPDRTRNHVRSVLRSTTGPIGKSIDGREARLRQGHATDPDPRVAFRDDQGRLRRNVLAVLCC